MAYNVLIMAGKYKSACARRVLHWSTDYVLILVVDSFIK